MAAEDGKRILQLDAGTLAELKATGYLPVAIDGKTYRLPLAPLAGKYEYFETGASKVTVEGAISVASRNTTSGSSVTAYDSEGNSIGLLAPISRTSQAKKILSWTGETVSWSDPDSYTLPTASTTVLGGIKVDGTTITVDANGVVSASSSGSSDHLVLASSIATTPGNLAAVLVPASEDEPITLTPIGNQLRVHVATDMTSDPYLATCEEQDINSSSSNYGGYSLATGITDLVWDDSTSVSWINAQIYQHQRISKAQGTLSKCNLALAGTLAFTDPVPCFNVGIFSTDGVLLGSSGLRKYGTDFTSGEKLLSVDLTEASTGSLKIKRNQRYIVQIWSCGCQFASQEHVSQSNYVYDYTLRQNLTTTTSSPAFVATSASMNKSDIIPFFSFGAVALN